VYAWLRRELASVRASGLRGWVDLSALLLLAVFLVAVPFPYGGIVPSGMLSIELCAFSLLLLSLLGQGRLDRLRGALLPVASMASLALLGVLQLLPLPAALVSLVSPTSARVYTDAATARALFGRPAPAPRISIAPTETADTILLTLAYLALFIAAVLLLRSRRRRRFFVAVFLAGAMAHAVVSIVGRSAEPATADSRLHGAFVNANHFAGYLEIALAVAFGVLWREVLYSRERGERIRRGRGRLEKRLMQLSWRVLLWGAFVAAIGLTKSRGGVLVVILMTPAMLSLALMHPRLRNGRLAGAIAGSGALAAGIGFVILAVRQQPIIRFLSSDPRDPASDLRTTLWRLSLEAWKQFPLVGSGLGTFREAFRRIQPREFDYLVEFAHSDPLQLLVTGGLLGFLLGAAGAAGLIVVLLRRWSAEQRREEGAWLLAGIGALVSLGLHGLAEFNLSIPAIPATLACIAGLAWAAGGTDDPRAGTVARH
jgi:putative inorganic carbon (HCO3(-)) transporter